MRHSFSEAQLTQPWGHGEHSLVAGGINQTNIFTLVIFFLILVEDPWKQHEHIISPICNETPILCKVSDMNTLVDS